MINTLEEEGVDRKGFKEQVIVELHLKNVMQEHSLQRK